MNHRADPDLLRLLLWPGIPELHPTKYAEELVKKMEKSGCSLPCKILGERKLQAYSTKDTCGIIDDLSWAALSIMHRPRRSCTSTSQFRLSFRVLIRQSLTRVIPTLMLPSETKAHLASRFVKNPAKIRRQRSCKALLLQVRRLNRPTLRKTRNFYPNIKKAVRSGFILAGSSSSLFYMLQIFISEPSLRLTTVTSRLFYFTGRNFSVKRQIFVCIHANGFGEPGSIPYLRLLGSSAS